MELTSAELTVLGLIVEQPRHGYDVEQVIEKRGIRQWTDIGFSSIYYLLTKLEKAKLIEVEDGSHGPKSRRVLKPTAAGTRVAATAALSFIADLRTVQHPILVGLANLSLLPESEYKEALSARLTQVEARIASIKQAEQRQSPLPKSAREIFSYSLSVLDAERAWLAQRIQATNE